MSFRSWAALGLLVCALAAERSGYYGVRSFLMFHLHDRGMSTVEASSVFSVFSLVASVAPFAGGGLALLVGPRLAAAIAAFVGALGAFALATGAPPVLSLIVLGLGSGAFRPCPFVAGAEILADEDGGAAQGFAPSARRFMSVAAFVVLAYAAINLGALIAPVATGVLASARDVSTSFGVAGALQLLGALLAGAAWFLGTSRARELAKAAHDPYRSAQGAPVAAPTLANDSTVFGPLVLLGFAFAAMHLAFEKTMPLSSDMRDARWIYSINVVVVLLLALPSFVLYLVLANQRSALPLTRLLGPGLIVYGAGMIISTFAYATRASTLIAALGLVVTAAGEGIAGPIALAYAALAWRGRAATLVVGGWLSLTYLPSLMLRAAAMGGNSEQSAIVHGSLGVLAAIGVGVYVSTSARRIHAQLSGSV